MEITKPVLITAAAALLLGACGSSPERPDRQLARAESSIQQAERTGARHHGSLALDRAREKLNQARQAVDREDMELADRLAQEAEVDARLAAAQADRYESEDALREVNDSIETLRRELERSENQGGINQGG